MGKFKGHLQQHAGAGATKDKTKGDQQQQADIVSSTEALTPQVQQSPKRGPPKDRSSPGEGSPVKRIRTAPSTNLGG